MKKQFKVMTSVALVLMALVLVLSSSKPVTQSGQTVTKNAMTDSVSVILKKSCTPCHSGGNPGATADLDITKWSEYTLREQVMKGNETCKTMTDGSMPPRAFRQAKPDAVPTEAEIALVCKWVSKLSAN